MIEAKNLCIGYEEKTIVDNFSFDVAEGEILSVIGPNGSGKSTLLRCISRYIKSKDGVVYFEKEDMNGMNRKNVAKKMASLSQYNKSPDDITVEDLIYYGRLPHKNGMKRKTVKT